MHREVKDIAVGEGAAAVGISTVDRLTDKPSMDAGYLLPGAKSIVSLMLPLDGVLIREYLEKRKRENFERHETDTYRRLFRMGQSVKEYLESKGYRAVVAEPNLDYRYKNEMRYKMIQPSIRQAFADWFASDSPQPIQWLKKKIAPPLYESSFKCIDWNLTPSFSHRYGAIAAGIGYPGWSGNVLHPEYGARVLYNTVITDCQLPADPMLEESPCDGCRICTRVCQSNFIHSKEKAHIRIGGKTFEHNKKAHNLRCIFVCSGLSGQNKCAEWSTWSPGRITLPESDDELVNFWREFVYQRLGSKNFYSKVLADLTYHSEKGFVRKKMDRFATTCGNCQLVCWKTRREREENYTLLLKGAVVRAVD